MPQTRMRDAAGIIRTITRIRMRDAAGILRTIQTIRMRDAAGTLRTVFSYFTVTLSTYSIYSAGSGATSTGTVTTGSVAGTVTGGVAAFTYLWERVSGDLSVNITTPNAISTTFSATLNYQRSAFFRLKVTDANGAISYSPNVFVQLDWLDTR